MLGLLRRTSLLTKLIFPTTFPRGFSLSGTNLVKEIIESQEGNARVFEGVIKPSVREPYILKKDNGEGSCPLCSLGLDVKHTDVLILSQFLRSDGCMLPRRVTKLCRNQQKRVTKMVAMAQKAGLMSNITPANSKKNPKLRHKWKKFNTYFDESTIKPIGWFKEPVGTIYESNKYKQNTRQISSKEARRKFSAKPSTPSSPLHGK